MDFVAVINERNKHISNSFSGNSNVNINNNANTNKNKKSNKTSKTEIKLAMVNSANITFADVDNEYIRSLRR